MVADANVSPWLGKKIDLLRKVLQRYDSVAVAFSGGVDSTVLLHLCCQLLPSNKVLALHARSCLHSARAIATTEEVIANHFAESCVLRIIECQPLSWPDFVKNSSRRCYHCKYHTYSLLHAEMRSWGGEVLLDGTNTDDLADDRPGIKAAQELGVQSPFLAAGMTKTDIREFARHAGLSNHDLPANSCLATRIPTGTTISEEWMHHIEQAEDFLHDLGFAGVRVRPIGQYVLIELQEKDLSLAMTVELRRKVAAYFVQKKMGKPYIGLKGR